MKKFITVLSLAAIVLSANVASANNNHGKKNGDHILASFANRIGKIKNISDTEFVITGNVVSSTATSLLINVKASVHVPTLTNNQATVLVDFATKINGDKNQVLTLADIKSGDQIAASGNVSGTTLTAKNIRVIYPKGKAYGEVTAKTDTSITLKNTLTGTTQTFTVNGDTKVNIDGQAKTATDVQVGDKGFVKFRTQVSGLFAKIVHLFR